MKLIVIATTVLHLAWGASIADVECPDSCICQNQELLEASCSSYEFIKKLLPKQETTIVRLSINNASLNSVDLKLKYLKNLHFLDLSNNHISALPPQFPYLPKLKSLNLTQNQITKVDFAQFPKNLRVVDLRHNKIANFPKDWTDLHQLQVLHFDGNPIDCDCDNLAIFEQLRKADVVISENLTCSSPKDFHGKLLTAVNCSLIKENLLNVMLGDEAGSGLEDTENHRDDFTDSDEEQFIKADGITTEKEDHDEGSGDGEEGSGSLIIEPITETPKACHFNCSTPRPIGLDDEKNASPSPGVQEQLKIIFEDIIPQVHVEPEEHAPTKSTVELVEVRVKEEPTNVNETSDKEVVSDFETFPTNDTVVGEMERASFDNNNNQSVYIIIGLLIAFVAFLLIYFLNKKKKKRTNRKRNKTNENGYGEEFQPLGKSAEAAKEQINSKPAENARLLNGNGKIAEDNLEAVNDENDSESVELRSHKDESLTPQPERVTIKAGELAEAIPKTPLLVHRQRNGDGEMVTTAINSN